MQSRVAKKPYNPILGEVFRCKWDLSDIGLGVTTYLGEQVSHHPPVSAFYFENKERQMFINSYVRTQSKFLGTSVAALLLGKAVVSFGTVGEDYVCTYPNAYGRSIFSVPKLELGGKTTVRCLQSGFYAEVEFKTKAFFGGTHDVSFLGPFLCGVWCACVCVSLALLWPNPPPRLLFPSPLPPLEHRPSSAIATRATLRW